MSYLFDAAIILLFISGVIRHIVHTISAVSEYREKRTNRLLERFKH